MTQLEFLSIFKPIVTRHPDTFTADVCEKVFKMFSTLDQNQAREVVSQLLLQSRMTPTEDDFREVIHMIKTKSNVIPFRISGGQQQPKQTLGPDETNEFFGFLKKITSKQMTQDQVKQAEALAWSVAHSRVKCRLCLDEGYVHAELRHMRAAPFAFKCQCSAGQNATGNIPIWRTEFTRDYRVILNGPEGA